MNAPSEPPDTWANAAAYDRYVGRWSRLVAREFLSWLAVPPGGHWLDAGCGTGALTAEILATAAPRLVTGIDTSASFIAYARAQQPDPRAGFHISDAQAIAESDATYDAAVGGLMLNFAPQPERVVTELARVTRAGGAVAVYVWDYAGEMQMMRHFWDAAAALDPGARRHVEGSRFPICRPEPLTALFSAAGLAEVDVRAIDVPTRFRDFDDYWDPFLGGQGPAPGYVMSLGAEPRAALRERVRAGLPIQPDGAIPLIARAWAVRGRV